jgi:DnaJ-class molecular chaperone
MKKSTLTLVIAATMLVSVGLVIASCGDTIWHLENDDLVVDELGTGVCTSCKTHEDIKKGHKDKKECDRCHGPGAKKQVHDVPVLRWDVTDPDAWGDFCSQCHEIKKGHMEQKKECLKCHGPGAKKDVHVQMPEEDCTTCHGDPTEGHGIDYAMQKCDACHDYINLLRDAGII